jgi:hypothetical protein
MTDDTSANERKRDAWEEDECLLCVPEHHPNCGKYTTVSVFDPATKPPGEDVSDHLVTIPLCIAHYNAIDQYQGGRTVSEVSV